MESIPVSCFPQKPATEMGVAAWPVNLGPENAGRFSGQTVRAFWGACRSLLFPKDRRRTDVGGLPIEEIMGAGPCVDLGLANLATETARTGLRVLLLCRSVIDPAIGAGEMFGSPYAAGHVETMRRATAIFQQRTRPQLMTHYPGKGLAPGWGLLPINLRPAPASQGQDGMGGPFNRWLARTNVS